MPETKRQPQTVATGVLIFNEDYTKVLLHRCKGPFGKGEYSGGGGKLEIGEHPTDALKREIKEEFNVTLKNIKFLSCGSFEKEGKHYLDIGFSAQIASGEPKIMESEKHEDLKWYSLDCLPEPLFEPDTFAVSAFKNGDIYFEASE